MIYLEDRGNFMDELYLVAIPTGPVLEIDREIRDKINDEFKHYSCLVPS